MCIPPKCISRVNISGPVSTPRLLWILLCIPIILFWSASLRQQSLDMWVLWDLLKHSNVYSSRGYLRSKYLWTFQCSETPLDTSVYSYHINLECISKATISGHVGTLTPPKTLKCVFLQSVSPEQISPDLWVLWDSFGYFYVLLSYYFRVHLRGNNLWTCGCSEIS